MEPKLLKEIKSFCDTRGIFYESFKESKFREEYSISERFVQDNHSVSVRNTIRGLHYQWDEPMGKLIRVCYGKILDVAVDIRAGSKTFGKVYYFEIGEDNLNQVYVPPGFAHGFSCLSETAHVLYKCTSEYNGSGESGINPLDSALGVDWGVDLAAAIISEKDRGAQSLEDYEKEAKFKI